MKHYIIIKIDDDTAYLLSYDEHKAKYTYDKNKAKSFKLESEAKEYCLNNFGPSWSITFNIKSE